MDQEVLDRTEYLQGKEKFETLSRDRRPQGPPTVKIGSDQVLNQLVETAQQQTRVAYKMEETLRVTRELILSHMNREQRVNCRGGFEVRGSSVDHQMRYSRERPSSRRENMPPTCYKCGQEGHCRSRCPDLCPGEREYYVRREQPRHQKKDVDEIPPTDATSRPTNEMGPNNQAYTASLQETAV